MPFPSARKKITFDDIDCPEYWWEFKTMTGMKYKEVRELFGNSPDDSPDSDYVEALLSKVILGWNLPEEDGGEVLPIPSTDPESIQRLPNVVITHLVEQISGSSNNENNADLAMTS